MSVGSAHALVTGFGPFEDVAINASGEIARRLDGAMIDGLAVRGVVLPTAFGVARQAITERARAPGCRAVVALGVWRGGVARLERGARGVVRSERADVEGEVWYGRVLGEDLVSAAPVAAWGRELGILVSEDCGGYVCNAAYHALLETRVDAVFMHMPRDVSARGIERAGALVMDVLARALFAGSREA